MPTLLSNAVKSGLEGYTATTNITAGSNLQGQSPLINELNIITTTSSNPSGVTLPTGILGKICIVVNRGTNPVNIYPATGGTIDELAANTSITIPVNGWIEFTASSSNQWYSSYNLISSSSFYSGTSTVDFGSHPGSNEASVAVTGQSIIGLSPKINIFVNGDDTTTDHTAADHRYLPLFTSFSAGNIIAGTGFTIYCRSLEKLQGTFKLTWQWSN